MKQQIKKMMVLQEEPWSERTSIPPSLSLTLSVCTILSLFVCLGLFLFFKLAISIFSGLPQRGRFFPRGFLGAAEERAQAEERRCGGDEQKLAELQQSRLRSVTPQDVCPNGPLGSISGEGDFSLGLGFRV